MAGWRGCQCQPYYRFWDAECEGAWLAKHAPNLAGQCVSPAQLLSRSLLRASGPQASHAVQCLHQTLDGVLPVFKQGPGVTPGMLCSVWRVAWWLLGGMLCLSATPSIIADAQCNQHSSNIGWTLPGEAVTTGLWSHCYTRVHMSVTVLPRGVHAVPW